MCEKKKKSVSLPCDSRQKRANRQHTFVVRSLAIVLEILRQQIRLSITNRTASPAQTRFDLLFPLFDKADQSCLVSMFLFTDLIHSRKISLLENIITGVHVIDSFSVGSSRLHKRNFSIPFSRMYFLNIVNKLLQKRKIALWPDTLETFSQFSSVQFSHSVVSDSLRPRESQHARPPCPSPSPGVHSNSRPSSL